MTTQAKGCPKLTVRLTPHRLGTTKAGSARFTYNLSLIHICTGVFLHGETGTRLAFLRGRAGILASEVAGALVETQEAVRRQQESATPGQVASG